MKEGLATTVIVVFAVLATLCKPSKQIPLCRSGANGEDCSKGAEQPIDQEVPTFSSRYRALEYDDAAMKLLMEMLLRQHNSFPDEDLTDFDSESESEDYRKSSFEVDSSPSFGSTENNLYGIINASQSAKPITVMSDQADQNSSNQTDPFLNLHQNPRKTMDNTSTTAFQGNFISKTFKDLSSIHQHGPTPKSGQLRSIADSYTNRNRLDSITPAHAEQNNLKLVAAVTAKQQPKSNSSSSSKNIHSSKYRDTKRRTTAIGSSRRSVLLRPRPFDGFSETQPLLTSSSTSSSSSLSLASGIYREHFKEPKTKPAKKKINSLKPADRDQDVKGEIQLQILNRPISAGNPMTTSPPPPPPDVRVGFGVGRVDDGCGNATSCRPNNKKSINRIKVKIGQKLAKMMSTTTRTTTRTITTSERRNFGKPPGIRFPNPNILKSVLATGPSSVSNNSNSTKPDGNLISVLDPISGREGDGDGDEYHAEDCDDKK